MPRVPGWSDDELERRAYGLAALIRRVWRAIARQIAAQAESQSTVTMAVAQPITSQWNNALDAEVVGYVKDMYLDAAGNISTALNAPTDMLIGDNLVEHHVNTARNRMSDIGTDVWRNVRAQITLGNQAGESIPEIAARIRNVAQMSEGRSMTIARTEVHAAHEAGSYDQALFVDPDAEKVWLATSDARTRDTHRLADGQKAKIGEPFRVGGSQLRFPGDPLGEPGETVNCRCSVAYNFDMITAMDEPVSDEAADADMDLVAASSSSSWKPHMHPRGADGKFIEKGALSDFLKKAKPNIVDVTKAVGQMNGAQYEKLTSAQKQYLKDSVEKLPKGTETYNKAKQQLNLVENLTAPKAKPTPKSSSPSAVKGYNPLHPASHTGKPSLTTLLKTAKHGDVLASGTKYNSAGQPQKFRITANKTDQTIIPPYFPDGKFILEMLKKDGTVGKTYNTYDTLTISQALFPLKPSAPGKTPKPVEWDVLPDASDVTPESAAPSTTTSLPDTVTVTPDVSAPKPSELKATGQYLGSHGSQVYTDAKGDRWLFKKQADFATHLDVGASELQKLAGRPAPDTYAITIDQTPGSIQRMLDGKDAFPGHPSYFNASGTTPQQRAELLREQPLDWLISNFDAHSENYIQLPDGQILGVDKGNGLKFFGQDSLLDYNWRPNEHRTVYSSLWQDYAAGKIDITDDDLKAINDSIERLQAIPDDKLKAMFRPYAEAANKKGVLLTAKANAWAEKLQTRTVPPGDVEAFLDALVARKKNLKVDFAGLYAKATVDRNEKTGSTKSAVGDWGDSPAVKPGYGVVLTGESPDYIQKLYDKGLLTQQEYEDALAPLTLQAHENALTSPPEPAKIADGLKGKPGDPAKITTGVVWAKHPAGTVIVEDQYGALRVVWNGKKYDIQESMSTPGTWVTKVSLTKKEFYEKHKGPNSGWFIPGGEKSNAAPSAPNDTDEMPPGVDDIDEMDSGVSVTTKPTPAPDLTKADATPFEAVQAIKSNPAQVMVSADGKWALAQSPNTAWGYYVAQKQDDDGLVHSHYVDDAFELSNIIGTYLMWHPAKEESSTLPPSAPTATPSLTDKQVVFTPDPGAPPLPKFVPDMSTVGTTTSGALYYIDDGTYSTYVTPDGKYTLSKSGHTYALRQYNDDDGSIITTYVRDGQGADQIIGNVAPIWYPAKLDMSTLTPAPMLMPTVPSLDLDIVDDKINMQEYTNGEIIGWLDHEYALVYSSFINGAQVKNSGDSNSDDPFDWDTVASYDSEIGEGSAIDQFITDYPGEKLYASQPAAPGADSSPTPTPTSLAPLINAPDISKSEKQFYLDEASTSTITPGEAVHLVTGTGEDALTYGEWSMLDDTQLAAITKALNKAVTGTTKIENASYALDKWKNFGNGDNVPTPTSSDKNAVRPNFVIKNPYLATTEKVQAAPPMSQAGGQLSLLTAKKVFADATLMDNAVVAYKAHGLDRIVWDDTEGAYLEQTYNGTEWVDVAVRGVIQTISEVRKQNNSWLVPHALINDATHNNSLYAATQGTPGDSLTDDYVQKLHDKTTLFADGTVVAVNESLKSIISQNAVGVWNVEKLNNNGTWSTTDFDINLWDYSDEGGWTVPATTGVVEFPNAPNVTPPVPPTPAPVPAFTFTPTPFDVSDIGISPGVQLISLDFAKINANKAKIPAGAVVAVDKNSGSTLIKAYDGTWAILDADNVPVGKTFKYPQDAWDKVSGSSWLSPSSATSSVPSAVTTPNTPTAPSVAPPSTPATAASKVLPSYKVTMLKASMKANGNVGYWSKADKIWEQIKTFQSEPGNESYSPMDILKALDSSLKTSKPNPFEEKMTKWAATAKGASIIGQTGIMGAPSSSTTPASTGLPKNTKITSAHATTLWNLAVNASNNTVLAYGQREGEPHARLVVAEVSGANIIVLQKKSAITNGWHYAAEFNDEQDLAAHLAHQETISKAEQYNWNTTEPATAQSKPKKSKFEMPDIEAGNDISTISDSKKSTVYQKFKSEPGTYLNSSDAGSNFDAFLEVSKAEGLTLGQVINIVDEAGAQKVSKPNEGLFKKKIAAWLKTPHATAHILNEPSSPAGLPTPPPWKAGIDPDTQLPSFEESSAYEYKHVTPSNAAAIWDDIVSKSSPLTSAEHSALKTWTGGTYMAINSYLYSGSGTSLSSTHATTMKNAQLGMRPSDRPMLLMRGVGYSGIGNAKNYAQLEKMVGQTWRNNAFSATSVGTEPAFASHPVWIEVEAPPGTPMAWLDPFSQHKGEREMLLGANLHFQIISVTKKQVGHYGEKPVVRVRIVPKPKSEDDDE